jgi:hypothetical protein
MFSVFRLGRLCSSWSRRKKVASVAFFDRPSADKIVRKFAPLTQNFKDPTAKNLIRQRSNAIAWFEKLLQRVGSHVFFLKFTSCLGGRCRFMWVGPVEIRYSNPSKCYHG